MRTGTSQLVGHIYIYQEGHCFDLDEGRQRKSGCCLTVSDSVKKCQQVITYCVVTSVQVPMNASSLQGGTDTFFVNFEMISQIANLIGCIVTLVALVGLLSVVCF